MFLCVNQALLRPIFFPPLDRSHPKWTHELQSNTPDFHSDNSGNENKLKKIRRK